MDIPRKDAVEGGNDDGLFFVVGIFTEREFHW